MDDNEISEICFPTVSEVLHAVSPNFRNKQKAIALISSMIATIACSKVSVLQVALGLFIQDKKSIQLLQEYAVTSSYYEVRRFKISAGDFASKEKRPVLDGNDGLVHGVYDNFDANLSTQNGLKQTHSLATILIQHSKTSNERTREPIPRLNQAELPSVELSEMQLKTYAGEKKPNMPESFSKNNVLPLKVLCNQHLTVRRSRHCDMQFIKDILTKKDVPDFGGYNTIAAREAGQIAKPKSRVIYKPLINKTPSDCSTVLSAMCEIERDTAHAGQQVTVFTCDQQLYRVTIDIIWNDPSRWANCYPRLGGMHWLMSFAGAIGKLMKNSGLDTWMSSAFAGVDKMLVGKKFPMNIRALRICAIELLRCLIETSTTYDDLDSKLCALSSKNRLDEHWVHDFVVPVFLMLMYVRAEREGEFGLHLYACKKMLPYFFAAGHWNYARDGVVYLRMMESLPVSLMNKFMKGEQ